MKRYQMKIYTIIITALFLGGCTLGSSGENILNKAAKAMDGTKYYKAKVTKEIKGVTVVELKEISGNNLHWLSQTTSEEQYYIKGILYTRASHGGWNTQEVTWDRTWKKVNNLDKATGIKVTGKKKVEGQECIVVTYELPFSSANKDEKLKATDYINAKTYRYVKATGKAKDYQETSVFYDYDQKIEITLPR